MVSLTQIPALLTSWQMVASQPNGTLIEEAQSFQVLLHVAILFGFWVKFVMLGDPGGGLAEVLRTRDAPWKLGCSKIVMELLQLAPVAVMTKFCELSCH